MGAGSARSWGLRGAEGALFRRSLVLGGTSPPAGPRPYLVNGPRPQPGLPTLILAQVDLAHPRLDLRTPRAQAVPRHRRHQHARRGARDHCLQTPGEQGVTRGGELGWEKADGVIPGPYPTRAPHFSGAEREQGSMKPLGGAKVPLKTARKMGRGWVCTERGPSFSKINWY